MNVVDRWKRINDILENSDYATVDDLVKAVGSSPATIRRDLKAMEGEGMLKRFHGGARAIKHGYTSALSIDKRLSERREAKQLISRTAASLIEDNDFVYIDTSSTTYFIADYLTASNVTIITNSVLLLPKLLKLRVHTYALGGDVDFEGGAIMGEDATEKIKSMNFTKAFIGTYGIDLDYGFTTYHMPESEMKRRLLERTKQAFVLADSHKFDKSAFYTFGSLQEATVITDSAPEPYRKAGSFIICEQDKN